MKKITRLIPSAIRISTLVFSTFSLGVCLFSWVFHYLAIRAGVEVPFFFYKRGSLLVSSLWMIGFIVLYCLLAFYINQFRLKLPSLKLKNWQIILTIIAVSMTIDFVCASGKLDIEIPSPGSDQYAYYQSALNFARNNYNLLFFNRGHIGLLRAPLIFLWGTDVRSFYWLDSLMKALTGVLIWASLTNFLPQEKKLSYIVALSYISLIPIAIQPTFLMADNAYAFSLMIATYCLSKWSTNKNNLWLIYLGIATAAAHWIRPASLTYWFAVILFMILLIEKNIKLHKILKSGTIYSAVFFIGISWLIWCNWLTQGSFSPSYMEARGYIFFQGVIPYELGHQTKGDLNRFTANTSFVQEKLNKEFGVDSPLAFGHKKKQDFVFSLGIKHIKDNPLEFIGHATLHKWARLWLSENQSPSFLSWLSLRQSEALLVFTFCGLLSILIQAWRGYRIPEIITFAVLLVSATAMLHWILDSFDRYALFCYPWMLLIAFYGLKTLAELKPNAD